MLRYALVSLVSFGLVAGCEERQPVAPALTPGAATADVSPVHVPAAASDVTATPRYSSTIDVTWHGNEAGPTTYRAYRSVDDGATWQVLSTNSWNYAGYALPYTLSVTDAAARGDQRVCYRVIASSSAGEAAPSDVVCAVPVAPATNVSVIRLDSATVDVSWRDASGIEEAYEVWANFTTPYRCNGPACNGDIGYGSLLLATLPANATSYRCDQCTPYVLVDDEPYWLTHLSVIATTGSTRSTSASGVVP